MIKRRGQRGYLLVTVIITLFLVASIAMLLAHDSTNSANTSNRELETARVEYVAQAGLQHALWRAQNNACMGNVTIPDTALGADTYNATISGAAAGTAYTLSADQDAWIRSDDVSRNNGTNISNHIKNQSGNVEQVLTRFDVSSIAPNAEISSAVAWFHLKAGKTHPEGPITVHEVVADWAEAAVTWESFAGAYRSGAIGMIPAQDAGDVWVAVNLTAQVQAWVNGQPNYGILFDTQAEGVHTEYTAREDGSNAPRLEVVVGSGAASPVTIDVTGTLANSNSRVLTRSTSALQASTTTGLQPDAAGGNDAEIWAQSPGNNYGDATSTWVSSESNDTTRSLLRFKVSRIPAGAKVLEATLSLYRQSGSGTNQPVSAHRIVESWVEGSVTWDNRESGTNWNTAGGDFVSAPVATTPIGSANQRYQWNISPLVQGWVDGSYPNYGVAMVGAIAGMPGERFYTSDHTDPTLHPSLTITYACECGRPCMAPQGSGNVLMVIGSSPSNPSPDDMSIRDHVESWGYAVTFIQDDDNQASFTSAMANNDVVFVSETVTSGNVGTKLTNATIGVVTAERQLGDELGIATSSGTAVADSVDILNNNHYITSIFQPGILPLKKYATQLATTSGTLSPDAYILAGIGGEGGLVALDAGAASAAGGTVAGRRVLIPVGGGTVDWSYLTSNGRLIVQRSLDWAMNTKNLRILFVVGISGSLQTRDIDRRDLFESWGYKVTIIDDGATQAEFDAELALNDVVYVGGTVVAGNLDTKLNATTLGLVNEVGGQIDDFGFHGNLNAGSIFYDSFTATDAHHYITEPFAGNAVTHFTTSMAMPAAHTPLAPDIGEVAAIGTVTWALPVLPAGAERWDGAPSAGRRVHLPFSEADESQMTPDGLTIMQRSIEWAGGAGPSSKPLLFVVGNEAALTAEETSHQVLIESWGYQVTFIDDSSSQADLEAAASASEVVYVSEEIDQSQLTDKLRNTPTGVVVEEQFLFQEFGFSASFSQKPRADIDVVDNSHYITSEFPLGLLDIYTSDQLSSMVINLAIGTQNLAELNNTGPSWEPAVAIINQGDEMYGGGEAPGRRAKVPFVSIAALNANGQTLMRRAIEWAAGAGPKYGLIAHWKFEEGAGLVAVDSVGGHDGTLFNGPVWSPGQVGGALDFDGGNDYVEVPHDNTLSLMQGMTFSAWANVHNFGSGYQAILSKDTPGNGQSNYWFGVRQGEIVFGFWASGAFRTVQSSGLALQEGSWYHVAASFGNATDEVLLYLDGSQVHSASFAFEPTSETASILIGKSVDGEDWDGLLDEVRIDNRVLDASEVSDLFNAGSSGPIAHWKLDDGTGATAIDSIGGHDGTLINGPVWSAGQVGGALEFDGSNDFVEVPHSDLLSVTDRFTLSAWVYNKAPGLPGSYRIVSKETNGSNDSFWVSIQGGSLWVGVGGNFYTPSTSFVADTWYHIAVSFDGSVDQLWIYVDGNLVLDQTTTATISPNTAPILIGANWESNKYWDGLLDEVRIDNQALNASEVSNLFTAGAGAGAGGGGGPCAGTFRDEFNAVSYDGNDGTQSWAGPWTEINENGNVSNGDERVDDNDSDYHLRVRDNDGGGEGVQREADLSAHTSATFSLEYRRDGFDDNNDYVMVHVSSDGGSNWTEMDRFVGPGTDSSYISESYPITDYISSNTRIRFLTSPNHGSDDEMYIDNVEISVSGCANP